MATIKDDLATKAKPTPQQTIAPDDDLSDRLSCGVVLIVAIVLDLSFAIAVLWLLWDKW